MRNVWTCSALALAWGCVATSASAQDLVYEPINPSFGGNPFNSGHLLAIANAQNDYEPEVEDIDETQAQLDRFIRSLQSRLLSSLSTQVANAIFGEDAQDEGTIVFGDQTISFVRTLDGIQLTITSADGSQTVITIPVFTPGDGTDDGSDDGSTGTGDGGGDGTTTTGQRSPLLTAASGKSLERSEIRDMFEDRVRVITLERQLGLAPGEVARTRSPEANLLLQNDPLVSGGALANPDALSSTNRVPIR